MWGLKSAPSTDAATSFGAWQVRDTSGYEAAAGTVAGLSLTWRGVDEARGLLAAFGAMDSGVKLSKRLRLPFSGAQRGLRGFRCVVRDLRGSGGVPHLPLTPQSPLLRLCNGDLEEGVVQVLIVDDIPSSGGHAECRLAL